MSDAMSEKRLLVVDDEPRFRDFVARVAKKLGFQVKTAADGREFMALCEVFKPHMAVIDLVMPRMDGVELVQWLADNKIDLHLIIVTGFAPNYAILAKKLGEAKGLRSVTTLNKPVHMAALQDALTRAE
jgi:CheY-like chemotaxis protein